MKSFLSRYNKSIIGVINGFDRICFRGTLRRIAHSEVMRSFMSYHHILLKDFGKWSQFVTGQIRHGSEQLAHNAKRPIIYISSNSISKEKIAKKIAEEDNITEGLICTLSSVDPCFTFDVRGDRDTKKLKLKVRERKCIWIYHYFMHPVLGFMHARIQTWLPLTIKICINGREWLARQMDREGIDYIRRENCFQFISDPEKAQELMNEQSLTDWPVLLNEIQKQISPVHRQVFSFHPLEYYWSADETEWATDIMFKNPDLLAKIYPRFLYYGVRVFGSGEVMRFLGHKVPAHGKVHGRFAGEVVTDLKKRPEGIRIKHRVNNNSVKMYDKQESVLRVETTINNNREFKVYRKPENQPDAEMSWLRLRKGVADIHRRGQISQKCNERYLEALSSIDQNSTLKEILSPICCYTFWQGKRARAINPWASDDAELLLAICNGKFFVNGFRNRDLVSVLFPNLGTSRKKEYRRCSGKVTRKLRLLRAHGIIKKVSHSHRYMLTEKGRKMTTAIKVAKDTSVSSLMDLAA